MSFLDDFRGLPRPFWFLWIGTIINRLGGFVSPFLALFLSEERALSVEETGLIVSLFGLGQLGAGLLGGFLADRLGRRATMLLGLTLGPVSMLFLAYAPSTPLIAAATFALGLLEDLYRPASSAALADLTPPARRAQVFGLLHWAVNLGFAVAPLVAGLVASKNFTILFLADAGATLVFALLVSLFVPETKPKEQDGSERHVTVAEALAPFRDLVFMSFWLLILCIALVYHQSYVTLPLAMTAKGLSRAEYGVTVAVNGAAIVLIQPFALRILPRLQRSRVLAASALLTGIGFGLNAFASTAFAYGGCVIIWTLGEIALAPVAPAIVADLSPERLRGSYQGIHQVAWGASSFIAPALGSWLLGRFGDVELWSFCVVLSLVATLGQLLLAESVKRSSETAALRDQARRPDVRSDRLPR